MWAGVGSSVPIEGGNLIGYGTDGTNSRRRIGDIPQATSAGWVRLVVDASQVGMEGQTAAGMSFDIYDGTAKWDHAGKVDINGREETWFEDALPAGALTYTPSGGWGGAWPWVASTSGPKADFGYTGHFFHEKSGLHLAYYRAYDAELGRWLSRDPIYHNSGAVYRYVANAPVNDWDPSGAIGLGEAFDKLKKGKDFFSSCKEIPKAMEDCVEAAKAHDSALDFASDFANIFSIIMSMDKLGKELETYTDEVKGSEATQNFLSKVGEGQGTYGFLAGAVTEALAWDALYHAHRDEFDGAMDAIRSIKGCKCVYDKLKGCLTGWDFLKQS